MVIKSVQTGIFILSDEKTEGVCTVLQDSEGDTDILKEYDDAERCLSHCKQRRSKNRSSKSVEIILELVVANCVQYGSSYGIIEPDELVIPLYDYL